VSKITEAFPNRGSQPCPSDIKHGNKLKIIVQKKKITAQHLCKSRDSSVSIVTTLQDGRPRFDSRQGLVIFLFATASRPGLGSTHPPIRQVSGDLSSEVKQPERKVKHSPPSNAEVNNAWSYTSNPQYVFMVWCLIEQWIYLHGVQI
jgi:hypothetical protein